MFAEAHGESHTDSGIVGLDRQLVEVLKKDGRISYSDLSRIVGLSGDAVRVRLNHLISQGKIKVVGSVSAAVLGCGSFALAALKVHGPSRAVARRIAEIPTVDFVACVAGQYDVLVQLACRDDEELLTNIDDRIRTIEGVVVQDVFTYLTIEKDLTGTDPEQPSESAPLPSLDKADRALIKALQSDGRASFRELQEVSGLTYSSTRRHVRALMDSGLLRIVTIENPLSMRSRVQATIGVTVHGPIGPALTTLKQIPEIEVLITAAGSFDLLMEVSCTDKEALARLTGDRLRTIAGVVGSHTLQYLEVVKLPYAWAGLVHDSLGLPIGPTD
ncbi:Lrp/AsnC family transcriptional regulator [Streptomyces sp. NPDC001663]|uniref:Lrp/AsnC family transcriptional regulator n=1 Tax=Streptomyces sp. NPDC001663 TaxID=3364597 RepID=UPI0036CFA0E3